MSHPTLLFREDDWEDGAVPSQRAARAEAKLRRLGYDRTADIAAELRAKWTKYTGETWVAEVRQAAQMLVWTNPQVPWRLFLFACGWLRWPTEAFPRDWDPHGREGVEAHQ